MGDCGDDFKALREHNRERKNDNLERNKAHMISCGLSYNVDSSGSMYFATDKGTVVFYPTTNKYQHKSKVRYGSAPTCEKYIRSLFS